MPDMTPVGNTIIPPNPNQGIQTLSGILGIQQQRQALQTGQYQQETAQAESQQAQQKNTELQKVGALTQGAYSSGKYAKSDGTFDNQKFANDVAIVAPTYGQQIANDATMRAGEIYKNQKTLFEMDSAKRAQVGNVFGGLASKPDVNHSDVVDALTTLDEQYPDDHDLHRMTHSMGAALPPDASGPKLQQMLNTAASMAKGEPGVEPATNAANQLVNRAKYSGQLSPAGQVGTAGGKGPGLNPSSPAVAGATTRQVATGNADVDRANAVSSMLQPSSSAIEITKRMDVLKDALDSGTLAKKISEAGNYLGFSSVNEARAQLNNDLGKIKTLATDRASTDDRAKTILEGYPSDTTPNNTFHADMDYLRGTARQNLARGQILQQYQKNDPQGLRGFQAADNVLTSNTDPLMHEYMALKPADRSTFYRHNFKTPEEAQEFKNRVSAVQKHTNVFGQ